MNLCSVFGFKTFYKINASFRHSVREIVLLESHLYQLRSDTTIINFTHVSSFNKIQYFHAILCFCYEWNGIYLLF